MRNSLFIKHGCCMAAGEIRGEARGASKCLVEPNGYIPMKKQIERARDAGLRLEEYRKRVYSYPAGDYYNVDALSPFDEPDFMPSVDMPSAMAYASALKDRQEAAKKDAASFPASPKDEGAPQNKAVATEDEGAAE